jgi:hypothetical protein
MAGFHEPDELWPLPGVLTAFQSIVSCNGGHHPSRAVTVIIAEERQALSRMRCRR